MSLNYAPSEVSAATYADIFAKERAQAYSMVEYDSFDYDFGQGSGAAVPLEEFDLGDYR